MTTRQDIQRQVAGYIAGSFLSAEQAGGFDTRTDLLALLDSLQLLRTVVQLEALFGVQVADGELTAENFGSVERIAALVERKQRESLTCGEASA
jgi:acyl carrier protein